MLTKKFLKPLQKAISGTFLELLPGFGPGTSSLPIAFYCSQEASADPGESCLIPVISRLETLVFLVFYQRIQSKTKPFYCENRAFVRDLLEARGNNPDRRSSSALRLPCPIRQAQRADQVHQKPAEGFESGIQYRSGAKSYIDYSSKMVFRSSSAAPVGAML